MRLVSLAEKNDKVRAQALVFLLELSIQEKKLFYYYEAARITKRIYGDKDGNINGI